jgi:hypothetical protein
MQQKLSAARPLIKVTIPDWLLSCCRNWHSGSLLCKQKVTGDLTGVVFTEDSSHVLAAGRTALKVCGLIHIHALSSINVCSRSHPSSATCVDGLTDVAISTHVHDSNIHHHMWLSALQSWSLSWSSPRPRRSRSSGGGANGFDAASNALSLTERQVNLKQQRASSFVDLCLAPSGAGQPVGSVGVYALTDKGNLLLLRPTGRTVDRSINLQVCWVEL